MKLSVELRKKLAAIDAELKGILDSAKTENRSLNDTEQNTFNTKFAEAEGLKKSIEDAEKIEAFEVRMASEKGVEVPNVINTHKEKYSILGHINAVRSGKVEGIFAEAQAEGEKELRSAGVAVNANAVYIPTNYRDFSVGGDSGTKGGKMVATEKGGIIESLWEGSLLNKLGATSFLGLTSNLDLPKGGKVTSTWLGENAENTASDHTIGQIELRPNRLATRMNVSNLLMTQSNESVEAYLRSEIEKSIQKALDEKYIEFLLASSDVQGVVMGVSGDTLTYEKVQEFIEKVGKAEADVAASKFLINYDVHSALKALPKVVGSDKFVLQDGRLDGFEFVVSNRVPSNLTKGGTNNLSAMMFGNWSDAIVDGFGAIEILLDPYSRGQFGQTVLQLGSYWDIKDMYAEGKAVAKDIVA